VGARRASRTRGQGARRQRGARRVRAGCLAAESDLSSHFVRPWLPARRKHAGQVLCRSFVCSHVLDLLEHHHDVEPWSSACWPRATAAAAATRRPTAFTRLGTSLVDASCCSRVEVPHANVDVRAPARTLASCTWRRREVGHAHTSHRSCRFFSAPAVDTGRGRVMRRPNKAALTAGPGRQATAARPRRRAWSPAGFATS
jgi:hypothetical protein